MSLTKRIEYIDALRGFTMILVVSVHIYSLCFMQGNAKEYDLSFNNFFGLFRMPLFFFISGFVFYKTDRYWNFKTIKDFITSKIRVQLISTFLFLLMFCVLYQKGIYNALFDNQKAGYWFTYILFAYFILYIAIDKTICYWGQKTAFSNITIATSLIIGLFVYHFVNNGYLLNIFSPNLTNLLSISKLQYFLFFSFGCFSHKYYNYFIKFQTIKNINGGMLLFFTFIAFCIFYQNNNGTFITNNSILALFAALLGIILAMSIFKANENRLSSSTKLGKYLQFIGKHTLDIYFLHYFFLPYNMPFVGNFFALYPNPLLEFCLSIALTFIVILCCLFTSRIIRMSPLLAHFLLGKKDI